MLPDKGKCYERKRQICQSYVFPQRSPRSLQARHKIRRETYYACAQVNTWQKIYPICTSLENHLLCLAYFLPRLLFCVQSGQLSSLGPMSGSSLKMSTPNETSGRQNPLVGVLSINRASQISRMHFPETSRHMGNLPCIGNNRCHDLYTLRQSDRRDLCSIRFDHDWETWGQTGRSRLENCHVKRPSKNIKTVTSGLEVLF
jgi:hypothetical protein